MAIRIAVIDSSDQYQQSMDRSEICYDSFFDEIFWHKYHGDICAKIIESDNQDVDIKCYKVFFEESLSTSRKRLIRCIDKCRKDKVKVINLSLGSTYSKDFSCLERKSKQLAEEGIIVVASISNDNSKTMPAFSPHTIGIGCDPNLNNKQFYCVDEKNGLFMGSGICSISINDKITIKTPAYSSFAAPVMVGNILSIIEDSQNIDVYGVKKALALSSKHVTQSHITNNLSSIISIGISFDDGLAELLLNHFERKGFSVRIVDEEDSKLFKSDILIKKYKGEVSYSDLDIYISKEENKYKIFVPETGLEEKCICRMQVVRKIKEIVIE